MKHVVCAAAILLMLAACSPNKPSPLFLTILTPHDGDTVKALVDSVAGKTYFGARVSIGFAQNSPDTTLVPDDSGRFAGTYTIPSDETGPYSVYISASFGGLSITETRTVNYVRQN